MYQLSVVKICNVSLGQANPPDLGLVMLLICGCRSNAFCGC